MEQLQSTIEFSYRGALDPANSNKNRLETVLARMLFSIEGLFYRIILVFYLADSSRPYLMTQVDKMTDYINAVFVNVSVKLSFLLMNGKEYH